MTKCLYKQYITNLNIQIINMTFLTKFKYRNYLLSMYRKVINK